ncbi:hypothetical protein MKZ24_03610 [Paenibacillus sp. FSL R7-0297]|uniref:hypothetical protein n=1 Tax=Paenibacillus TaxID=44249 RepID=UPI00300BB652
MLSPDQKLNLFELLKARRGDDPWPLHRVGRHIAFPVNTLKEKNALRYQIKKLRKHPDLEYLANIGKGYFIPEYQYEFEEVSTTFKNRANGMAETAERYKVGGYRAKKSTRDHEQLSFDFDDASEQ